MASRFSEIISLEDQYEVAKGRATIAQAGIAAQYYMQHFLRAIYIGIEYPLTLKALLATNPRDAELWRRP